MALYKNMVWSHGSFYGSFGPKRGSFGEKKLATLEEVKPSRQMSAKLSASTKDWRPLTPPFDLEMNLAASDEDSNSDEDQ